MFKKQADWLIRYVLPAVAHGTRGIILNNHAQNAIQIRTQVHALSPFFDFIGYEDLKDRLFSKHWKKPFCLLTFDDGKAVNAEETAPELIQLGVPAVFFLSTGLVGTDRVHWFDRLTTLRRAEVPDLPNLSVWKTLAWQERDRKLDELCQRSGIEADRSDSTMRMMTWDDAVRMQKDGFEMGSHTAMHAVLTVESHEQAVVQLQTSVQSLTDHGLRTRAFAFPNGNCSEALVSAALDAGFESTFSTAPLWINGSESLTCLPRLFLKETADEFYVHTKLLMARPGFILKNPNGEGRRYRRAVVK